MNDGTRGNSDINLGAALLERSIFPDFLKIGWCFVYVDR